MNSAEQQKTVGLWATRSKALESGSKLLGFQYCEARGQAPPLKVAGVPVRKRCLIALVQYAITAMKVNGSRLDCGRSGNLTAPNSSAILASPHPEGVEEDGDAGQSEACQEPQETDLLQKWLAGSLKS